MSGPVLFRSGFAAEMHFTLLGLSHKTAPIDIREKLSFSRAALTDALGHLRERGLARECAILSTCNRVEIYALTDGPDVSALKSFMLDSHNLDMDIDKYCYCLSDAEAIRHVCMVASGLDSMVLGEPQIFGQLKDALSQAIELKAVGKTLEHLFARVFSIVKKVRTKTKIGEFPVSVSHAAVKLAQEVFPALEKTTALIIGAGDMGELTLRNLMTSGVKDIFVTNRTFQKAVELSEQCKGTPIMLHEIVDYLPKVDIVVSSVTTSAYVITKSDIISLHANQVRKCLFIIDISVPRSIDPAIAEIDSVRLCNIDDLQEIASSHGEVRKQEAVKAQAIIDEKVPEVVRFLRTVDFQPTLALVREEAERIRKQVLAETEAATQFSSEHLQVIDAMTKALVEKVIQHSEHRIKEHASAVLR